MSDIKNKSILRTKMAYLVLVLVLAAGLLYYVYFFTPKNSLELYQALHFSDNFEDTQKLILDGYEDNFTEVDFKYIQLHSPDHIKQITLFEYNEKSYVVLTSPGTERLKILGVEELPEDIRTFFSDLPK